MNYDQTKQPCIGVVKATLRVCGKLTARRGWDRLGGGHVPMCATHQHSGTMKAMGYSPTVKRPVR